MLLFDIVAIQVFVVRFTIFTCEFPLEMAGYSTNNPWRPPVTPLTANQDTSSVFYIHPSDANTTQLVSVKFNGTGYSNWKRSMMLSLSAENKIGFIDGTIMKPNPDTVDLKSWERCNDLVCSWLLCNLDDTIFRSVLFFKSTREIWLDLEERFGYASMTQIFSIQQQLADLHQAHKSVSDFFTEIKTLWDAESDISPLPCCTCNKCTCNVTQKVLQMQQDHRLLQFMLNLSDKYATIRGNILMQQPLPTLSNAFKIFSQEERHQEFSHNTGAGQKTLAFLADNKYRGPGGSNVNGPNFQKPNNAGKSNKKNTYYCTHCKMAGHSVERCFKIHGYPPNFKGGQKDKRLAAAVTVGNSEKKDNGNFSAAQYQ